MCYEDLYHLITSENGQVPSRLAHSVSEAASVAWTHYTTTERAEPLLARLHYQSDLNNLTKSDNLNEQDEVPVPTDDQPSSEDGQFDPYTAQSLVCELKNQVMMSQALAAEATFITQQATFEVQEQPLPPEDETREVQDIPENITIETVVSQNTTRQQSDEVIAMQDNDAHVDVPTEMSPLHGRLGHTTEQHQ